MDFPVCPSCHQSVIDDDAVDCPFCGASMKAKPGAKPAAKPAAASAPASKPSGATPESAAKKPSPSIARTGGGVRSAKPGPADDFPFEEEINAGKAAIQSLPNPTKQRTLKIVCPMCDTTGYVPANAAGKDVRCSNPKCVMPVFTAPVEKKVEVAPPPPPPKSSMLPLIGGSLVVLLLLIGGGLYVLKLPPFGGGGVKPKQLSQEAIDFMREEAERNKALAEAAPIAADPAKAKGTDNAADPEVAKAEFVKSILAQMRTSSLEDNKTQRGRGKPFCRQLAAEANAVAGFPKDAREHLDQLMKVQAQLSYYRVVPLLDLYWAAEKAGEKQTASKTLDAAVAEVPKIPKYGRTRFEISGRLAAALANEGRIPDALKLLNEMRAEGEEAEAESQFAARLQMALDGHVAPLSNQYAVMPWKEPQSVAATYSLIVRGEMDKAAAWANAQGSEDAKAACLAIWAQEVARQRAANGAVDADGLIAAAVKGLPPVVAARIWARAGIGRFEAKDPAGVKVAIQLAKEQLAQVPVPTSPKMPSFETTHRFKELPQIQPLIRAVIAACELANLQAQSKETLNDAEASVDLAMTFADGIAPSLTIAQQRMKEADQKGSRLRDELKRKLNLRTDDEARSATLNYNQALKEILNAAHERFDLETLLLSRLRGAGVGLNSKVWIVVNSRTTTDNIELKDNFLSTGLTGELIEGLKGTDEERQILGVWTAQSMPGKPIRPIAMEFRDRLNSDIAGAMKFLQGTKQSSNRREEIYLESASRLADSNQFSKACEFIAVIPADNVAMREDCYRLAASLATKQGHADAVWKQVGEVNYQTEKVSICRGLIAGLLGQ